jgi:hypothetical protein
MLRDHALSRPLADADRDCRAVLVGGGWFGFGCNAVPGSGYL